MKSNLETHMKERSKLFAQSNDIYSKKLKKEKKLHLLKSIGIKKNTNRPLISISLKKNDSEVNYLFEEIMPGLAELNITIIVLGEKKAHFSNYPNIHYLESSKKNIRQVIEAADLFLLPNIETEDIALINGTPCIFLNDINYRGHLIDFDPVAETGNSFAVKKTSVWQVFQSICKAIESYNFPYDWETLCKNSFETGRGL